MPTQMNRCTRALLRDIVLRNSPKLIQSDVLMHFGEMVQWGPSWYAQKGPPLIVMGPKALLEWPAGSLADTPGRMLSCSGTAGYLCVLMHTSNLNPLCLQQCPLLESRWTRVCVQTESTIAWHILYPLGTLPTCCISLLEQGKILEPWRVLLMGEQVALLGILSSRRVGIIVHSTIWRRITAILKYFSLWRIVGVGKVAPPEVAAQPPRRENGTNHPACLGSWHLSDFLGFHLNV